MEIKLKLILFDPIAFGDDLHKDIIELLNKEQKFSNIKYYGVLCLNLGEKIKVIDL